MKHKWKDDICIRCGCKRELVKIPKFYAEYVYTRAGILFNNRPDCIDWVLENSKTID